MALRRFSMRDRNKCRKPLTVDPLSSSPLPNPKTLCRGVDQTMCNPGALRCGVLHALPFIHHLTVQAGTKAQYSSNTALENMLDFYEAMDLGHNQQWLAPIWYFASQRLFHYLEPEQLASLAAAELAVYSAPSDADARLGLAAELGRRGHHQRALQLYRAVAATGRLPPVAASAADRQRAHLGAAEVLRAAGGAPAAIDEQRDAAEEQGADAEVERLSQEAAADPANAHLLVTAGDLLMGRKLAAAALGKYRARIALGPNDDADSLYRAHLGAARALEAKKAGTRAVADQYVAAADVQPLRKEAFYHLAVIHRQQNNMQACYRTIAEAAEQGPALEGAADVDALVYELGVDDELCTCAFYAKAFLDGLEACERVIKTLDGGKFPEQADIRGRIRQNINLYEKALEAEATDDEYAD
jgi:hypothetical protein